MKNRVTIYANKPIKRLFAGDEKQNVSGKLNQAIDRYLLICDSHSLDLTAEETEILTNAYKGLKRITAQDILNVGFYVDDFGLYSKIREATLADFVATLEGLNL